MEMKDRLTGAISGHRITSPHDQWRLRTEESIGAKNEISRRRGDKMSREATNKVVADLERTPVNDNATIRPSADATS